MRDRCVAHYTYYAHTYIHTYIPDVGSSRNRMLGILNSWTAMASLLRCRGGRREEGREGGRKGGREGGRKIHTLSINKEYISIASSCILLWYLSLNCEKKNWHSFHT
jgi:hypothetical protein